RKDGDVAAAMAGAAQKVEAIYEQPFLAHATMEPVNCTVHVRPDGCDVWVGTQVPTFTQNAAAKVTGLPKAKVRVHNHLLGGGFGRRLEVDFITRAVQIAKQVTGPVQVHWSREEDIQHDMYRPYYYDRIAAGLDAQGKPIAWTHRVTGACIIARVQRQLFPTNPRVIRAVARCSTALHGRRPCSSSRRSAPAGVGRCRRAAAGAGSRCCMPSAATSRRSRTSWYPSRATCGSGGWCVPWIAAPS